MTRNKIRTLFVLYYACKQNNTEKTNQIGVKNMIFWQLFLELLKKPMA